MTNSHTVSNHAKKILDDVLEQIDNTDDPLEFHLPEEVTKLDKATLLAVLYRVLAKVPC